MSNKYTYLGRTVRVEMIATLLNGNYTVEVRE